MSTAKDEWMKSELKAAEKAANGLLVRPKPIDKDWCKPMPTCRCIELITKAGGKVHFEHCEPLDSIGVRVDWKGEQYAKACDYENAEEVLPRLLTRFCVDYL